MPENNQYMIPERLYERFSFEMIKIPSRIYRHRYTLTLKSPLMQNPFQANLLLQFSCFQEFCKSQKNLIFPSEDVPAGFAVDIAII